MKETTVYLPVPHTVKEGGAPVFIAHEVYSAMDTAGIKWVQETPEELKIRMMTLQIEELKRAYVELQGQHVELRNVCTSLEDQNAALKMSLSRFGSQP